MENNNKENPKYTLKDLKNMQDWELDHKIEVSITRIIEFYSNFQDKIYILSFVNPNHSS